MDVYDLVLSAGPPTLAIALQFWSIPSKLTIARYAKEEQKRAGLGDGTARLIEYNLKGVVSISSLAATFVSFPSGLFALLKSEGSEFFIYCVVFVVALILLWIFNVISGRAPYELVVGRFRSFSNKPGKRFSSISRANAIDYVVYAINGLLIFLSLCLYFF